MTENKPTFILGEKIVAQTFLKGLERLIRIRQMEQRYSFKEAADATLDFITDKIKEMVINERSKRTDK